MDSGIYEIVTLKEIDRISFANNALTGTGRFYMIRINGDPDLWKFSGILYDINKQKPSTKIVLDLGEDHLFVKTSFNETKSPRQVADELFDIFEGIKMFNGGKLIKSQIRYGRSIKPKDPGKSIISVIGGGI